jgi:hypothetical protein
MKSNLSTAKIETDALQLAKAQANLHGQKLYFYLSQCVYKDIFGDNVPKKIPIFEEIPKSVKNSTKV